MEKTLNYEMLKNVQKELFRSNPFVVTFAAARVTEQQEEAEVLCIAIHNTHSKDMRNYKAPVVAEIAA